MALLVIVGSIPGVLFLKNVDTSIIKMFFGVVIIIIGLEMLLREFQTKKIKQSKVILGTIGVLSGLLCGIFAENTFRIILYGLWGIITLNILKQAIILIPLMVIGLVLGMFSGKFLDEKVIKKLVIAMLIVSGIALILNNL